MKTTQILWGMSLLMALVPSFSQAQEQQMAAYKIYDVTAGKVISFEAMIQAMNEADVLFFGEQHDDSLGHAMQDHIYTGLLDQYGQVCLSMEMFEADVQYILDEYLQGFITEDKFRNDARPWKNYQEHYRPMVETAKARGQAVVAANTPRRYVSMVSRKGLPHLETLPKTAKRFLPPLPIKTGSEAYYDRFQEAMGGADHGMGDNIYYAQCVWDAGMAYAIYQYWKKHKQEKIFHLIGRFHTDYQQGTFEQLQQFGKKIRIRNISCFPAEDFEEPDWEAYRDLGDFVIIHP